MRSEDDFISNGAQSTCLGAARYPTENFEALHRNDVIECIYGTICMHAETTIPTSHPRKLSLHLQAHVR